MQIRMAIIKKSTTINARESEEKMTANATTDKGLIPKIYKKLI